MSTGKELITVIIITFNSSEFIEGCIKSLIRYWPNKYLRQIVVIDNGSSDNTKKEIEKKIRHGIITNHNKKNLGFSKGVNKGIRLQRQSDYFLLINPDTEICRSAISIMATEIKRTKAGVCGGKTVGYNNETLGDHFRQVSLPVGLFDFTNLRKIITNDFWHRQFYYMDKNIADTQEVDAVTGGFMMITRDTIKQIGYFDEKFFMYLEDMDYCLRARENGIKTIYCPKAITKHYGGGSSNNKTRSNICAWLKSRRYYFLKHFSPIPNLIIQPIFIIDGWLIQIKELFHL